MGNPNMQLMRGPNGEVMMPPGMMQVCACVFTSGHLLALPCYSQLSDAWTPNVCVVFYKLYGRIGSDVS
jgi:hypothetical protein